MKPGIVVGYDRTRSSEDALDLAAADAARRGVELTVVHASHHGPAASPPRAVPPAERPMDAGPDAGAPNVVAPNVAAPDAAEEGADRARSSHPGLTVHPRAETGAAPSVLADLSSGAALLVVGHRGHGGFAGLELGSVAMRTVTRAVCPTVVARGAGHEARGVVLAAVDVGEEAEETLDFAFAEAVRRGARLRAVSAWEILWPWAPAGDAGDLNRATGRAREHADAVLERHLLPWRAKYPHASVEYEVVEGAPTEVLTAATTGADLVVVGARRRGRGHRGVRVGPTAHTLLRHADCPVAIVPHS